MKTQYIVCALAEKVEDTIYKEWHHEGYLELEQTDRFWFTLDGRLYKVTIEDIDAERPLTSKEMEE